jgi:hypothetical protein
MALRKTGSTGLTKQSILMMNAPMALQFSLVPDLGETEWRNWFESVLAVYGPCDCFNCQSMCKHC